MTCRALPPCGAREQNSGCLAEALGCRLAGAAVLLNLEIELLAFHQAGQTGALDGGDVDEDVLAAIVRLNEAEALGAVEPLNGTCWRGRTPWDRAGKKATDA